MSQATQATCPLCKKCDVKLHIPQKQNTSKSMNETYSCSSMGHGFHNDIYYCPSCQHGFLHPLPTADELEKFYTDVEDHVYLENIDSRVRTFNICLDRIGLNPQNNNATKQKLFEIGSYCGTFLSEAQKRGVEVNGVEPSQWARNEAQQRYNLNLMSGLFNKNFLETHKDLIGTMDYVVAWDILEHVEDPKEFTTLAGQLLKPGGKFYFSTLNIHSRYTRFMGSKWPWYMQMHLHYFTPKSLKDIVEGSELTFTNYRTHCHVITLPYLGQKLHALTGLPFHRLFNFKFFKPVFIPFSLGDIVTVCASKP